MLYLYRKNLNAWHGSDDLVLAVAAQNTNTIVIVHSVGPLIMEPWIEPPNVHCRSLQDLLILCTNSYFVGRCGQGQNGSS